MKGCTVNKCNALLHMKRYLKGPVFVTSSQQQWEIAPDRWPCLHVICKDMDVHSRSPRAQATYKVVTPEWEPRISES